MNNYDQQDEETGEGYAMLPNANSSQPADSFRRDGYAPLSGAAAKSNSKWGNKRKAAIFVG